MNKKYEKFITGNEAAVAGAKAAGASVMFGYPITPSTEILHGWIAECEKDKGLQYLQTEDETAAGFALIGAILAGEKAFTATAGPGHILMQDPLSMAENLRLPFVGIIMQRGGPSTGTVNFSQQEVNLAAFGGNGDGLRVVYSASNNSELFSLTAKAFSTAWKYRFPTLVLGDGHIAKIKTPAVLTPPIKPIQAVPILKENQTPTYLRNCYSSEEKFGQKLNENIQAWKESAESIAEFENYKLGGAKEIIIAHGSVADAAKDAIDYLRKKGRKIGLFRPITLNPFSKEINKIIKDKNIYIIESSLNQLSRIVKYETAGINAKFIEYSKPAVSFSSDEIVDLIEKGKK